MSNPEPTVKELQAEIDRLNAEMATRQGPGGPSSATTAAVSQGPTHGPSVIREPGTGATIIGASADNRGGTVIGYSDGTVKLFGVPNQGDSPALPWGSVPDGEYVAFYTDENGNRYNFVASDGASVASVENPNRTLP